MRPAAKGRLYGGRHVVIDENPPHHPRRHGEEVGAILPLHPLQVDEAQVALVDQRRGLQRVVLTLAGHVPPRQPSELFVHERNELVEGLRFAAPPCQEEFCRLCAIRGGTHA